jgi:hypothetical protein
MMSVEQSVERELAGEPEVLGENLPQRHFVQHKSHMTWPGLELGHIFSPAATFANIRRYFVEVHCLGGNLQYYQSMLLTTPAP